MSQQTRRQARLRQWQEFVKSEALRYWTRAPLNMHDPISITLIYIYSEAALDVDNVLKPVQDALIGLVYSDDSLVTDVIIRRRELGGTFDLSRVSTVLIDGFEYGDEFLYVRIANAPPQDRLL